MRNVSVLLFDKNCCLNPIIDLLRAAPEGEVIQRMSTGQGRHMLDMTSSSRFVCRDGEKTFNKLRRIVNLELFVCFTFIGLIQGFIIYIEISEHNSWPT